jgi:adenylate cyclase
MEFRIGVNSGDVMVEGEQIYGDGVNVAARLESLADPSGICISGTVYEQVRDKLPLGYDDRGEQAVKNIARPVHVWRIVVDGTPAPARLRGKYWRGAILSLTGIAMALGTFVVVQHLSLKPPHISASILPPEKNQNPHSYRLPQERGRGAKALPLPSIPSIAVLPFTNLGGDPKQEYFSDGITNDLITDLGRGPGIFVIDRASSFTYKGKPVRVQEVSRELGVKYVLEGGVQRDDDRVRISAQLVDATSGAELWAERYDRPMKDIFALQDDIVHRIVTTANLRLALWEQHGALIPDRTHNMEAYDDMLRGVSYLYTFSPAANAKAQEMFQKAITLDRGYADAYAALGNTYWLDWFWQLSRDPRAFDRAFEAEQTAISLDDSQPFAHALLGRLLVVRSQYDAAIAEGNRSIALAPNYAGCYIWLAESQALAGNPEETRRLAEKAMRLDPKNRDFPLNWIALADILAGRYTDAIPLIQQFLSSYPAFLGAHVTLAVAHMELGHDREARAEVAEILRLNPRFSITGFQKELAFRDHAINARWGSDLRQAGLK